MGIIENHLQTLNIYRTQALLRHIHMNPSSVGAHKAIFINFNSGKGTLPEVIVTTDHKGDFGKMLGAAMLFSSGNFEVGHQSSRKHVEFSVKVPDLRTTVKLIRGNLRMKESEMLR